MNIDIGKRITALRKEKGYSVNHLANQAGVSQSYLREIEMGHYQNPSVDILDAICEALGISLREFFDEYSNLRNTEDALVNEISKLTSEQREKLRLFLQSMF
ncbi:MAG: helix-turn-helix domain-containing protein [Lachnospiraceae bacterium]|nr:helix-turn-helix domain-containing protein [Lachnospiraceae bacterium]